MTNYLKKDTVLNTLIVLMIGWMFVGFFPIVNIEGDSAFYIAGCERLYQYGFTTPPDYIYEWDMQPLMAYLIVGIRSVVSFLNCEQIYCTITFILSTLYLFIASLFISKVTTLKWQYSFILLFLLPESYAISYYPNTAIPASLFAIMAFYSLLHNTKHADWIALALLIVAPLFRVDILIVYPVVFPIFLTKYNSIKSLIYSVSYAILIVGILSILFPLLGADPLQTLNTFMGLNEHNAQFTNGIESFLKINIAFFSVASVILLALGTYYCINQKKYLLLFLTYLPCVILYYIYFPFRGYATKHLQYILPFLGVLIAMSIINIQNYRKVHTFCIVLFIVLIQGFIGVSYRPASMPWISKEYAIMKPTPQLLSFDIGESNHAATIGIGAGQVIPTADEQILVTGHFFHPFYWRQKKLNAKIERDKIETIISEIKSDTIHIFTTQASDWKLSQNLHTSGFKLSFNDKQKIFKSNDNDKVIIVHYNSSIERNSNSFNDAFRNIKPRPLYVVVDWDWQKYFLLENKTDAVPLTTTFGVVY